MQVTVIMPARNAAAFITKALAPLVAHPRVSRVVVVNDGSTDETASVAKAHDKVAVFNQEAANQYVAMNRGLRLAFQSGIMETEAVAFRDADDVTLPDKLDLQLEVLANTKTVAVGGSTTEIDLHDRLLHDGKLAKPVERDPVPLAIRTQACTLWPAVSVFRTEVFRILGGFWPVPTMGDAEFCMRLCFWCHLRGLHAVNLREPVIHRRVHASSVQAGVGNPNHPTRAAIQAMLKHQHTFLATMLRQNKLDQDLLYRPAGCPDPFTT